MINSNLIEITIANRLQPVRDSLYPIPVGTLPQQANAYGENGDDGDIKIIIPTVDAARPEIEGGVQLAIIDILIIITLANRYENENTGKQAVEEARDDIFKLLKGFKPDGICSFPIWISGSKLFPPVNGLWTMECYFKFEKYI